MTFFGWYILGALTLGIFNIFFTNPYKTAVMTGYYARLREKAIAEGIEGAESLNDKYLYEKTG